MSQDVVELHAIVKGLVQGVCFRATAQEHAVALKLTGWVRNCSDGSVEIVAHGTKQELESLLSTLRANPGYGRVDSIDTTYRVIEASYTGFQIKR
ncbi:MAG: acylphosphatase [Chlamydiales bacterium]|nr:acylphosphatase [Chlamydiales bacterium]